VNQPLWILFNVYLSFKSPLQEHNVSEYIGNAFKSQQDQDDYIANLQSSNVRTFSTINSLQLYINGTLQKKLITNKVTLVPIDDKNSTKINWKLGVILGSVCIIFALAFAAVFILRRRHSKAEAGRPPPVEKPIVSNTFVQVHHGMEDISTLGDPMFGTGAAINKEPTLGESTVSVDYDYTGAYGGVGGANLTSISVGGATSGSKTKENLDSLLNDSNDPFGTTDTKEFPSPTPYLLTEDTSFEKQYVNKNCDNSSVDDDILFIINAPPGKLGIIIDAKDGISPKVHSIKESSVLKKDVKIGDRLISVDGEDTAGLSAIAVSKLIASKITNERQLMFSRKQKPI